jgi:hypothetical protein
MSKTFHTLMATVVAILFPMIAAAQRAPLDDDEPSCVETGTCSQECIEQCLGRLPACVTPFDANADTCAGIPACSSMTPTDVEILRRVCEACHEGGRACEASQTLAKDYAAVVKSIGQFFLPPSTPPPIARPPVARKDQAAWKMSTPPKPVPVAKAQVPDGSNELALVELKSRLEILQRDVDALKDAAKDRPQGQQGIDADALTDAVTRRIKRMLEHLLARPSVPQDVRAAMAPVIEDIDRRLANLELADETLHGGLSRRIDNDEHRLAKLENRVSGIFGLGLNVAANLHILAPYDNPIWGVWPEFFWLPEVTDGLRLELGSGIGYGGKSAEGEPLHVVPLMVGLMPEVADGFHLGFGFQGEWRIDPSEHLSTSSYGGYLEPKYCPGGGSSDNDAPLDTPPHFFCFGARAALEATIFQNPDPENRNTYTMPDGSFSLVLGYAFLP